MENYCAFSKNHKCLKWADYQLTKHELEEADSLCHGNWIEIQHLHDRMPYGSAQRIVLSTRNW